MGRTIPGAGIQEYIKMKKKKWVVAIILTVVPYNQLPQATVAMTLLPW